MLTLNGRCSPVVLAAFVLLYFGACGVFADDEPVYTQGIHDPKARLRTPSVVAVAFSQNSNRIAVSYYSSARNRAGTDWDSFAATWDLKTDRRTIGVAALGPLTVSNDGQWLAASYYERVRGRRSIRVPSQLAVVKFGEITPTYRFFMPRGAGGKGYPNPIAIAFHHSNNQVAWINQNGQVLIAKFEQKKQTVSEIEKIDLKVDLSSQRYTRRYHNAAKIEFNAEGTRLTMSAPIEVTYNHQLIRTIQWKFDSANHAAQKISDDEKKVPPLKSGRRSNVNDNSATFFSDDKSIRAEADSNGIVRLFKKDEATAFKTLRLDDELNREKSEPFVR